MILIEIKKEARYLKKNSQTPQEKTAKIQTDQINMAFGPITSCFSIEWDFSTKRREQFFEGGRGFVAKKARRVSF